jgi:predicted metal-dependent phosphoesterase TrpH
MIIDMHVHTEMSMDSNATVEAYCRAIQRFRQFHPFDGIVLAEHRMYKKKPEYRRLSEKYDVLILQGIEADASLGHLLIYGITDDFLKRIDISSRSVKEKDVMAAIGDCGGIAIPSHPYRDSTYGSAFEEGNEDVRDMKIVEELNGANSRAENDKARRLVAQNGLKGIGGSDAHYVNKHWFLRCATEFFNPIETMEDLIDELRADNFRPLYLDNSVLGDF